MLKTALWPLQQALFKRLEEDVALNEVITGVFDSVPEEKEDDEGNKIRVEFPYATIGEPTMIPFETKSSFGEEIAVVLHCWSRYPGKKEAYEILNLMLQAITKAPFTIEGFSLLRVKIEPNMQVLIDIDNITKHGVFRLKFFINN